MSAKLNRFLFAYIEAMLWSSTGDLQNPLNENYVAEDLDPKFLQQCRADCGGFIEKAGAMLAGWSPEQAGSDFWLTRNGHGAGFWDRDESLGFNDELSSLAESMGAIDVYVGGDGKLYGS